MVHASVPMPRNDLWGGTRWVQMRTDESGVWLTLDSKDYPSVADVIEFASCHTGCDFEVVEGYENMHHIELMGWRKSTDEELSALKTYQANQKNLDEKRKQVELNRARKLLRDAGEL